MSDTYVFALLNFLVCAAVVFICFCRLKNMDDCVLWRVRAEYSVLLGAALASSISPWFGEWPRWAQLGLGIGVLVSLLGSSHAWSGGRPPATSVRGGLR